MCEQTGKVPSQLGLSPHSRWPRNYAMFRRVLLDGIPQKTVAVEFGVTPSRVNTIVHSVAHRLRTKNGQGYFAALGIDIEEGLALLHANNLH